MALGAMRVEVRGCARKFEVSHMCVSVPTTRFSRESITQRSQVKASVFRGIKSRVVELYPALEPYIDDIFPKKAPLILAKSKEVQGTSLVAIDGEVLFIESRKFYFPSLRTLQKCMAIVAKRMHVLTDTDPFMMKKVGVDKGAIKFVLQGANVMCPGLTHPAGDLETDFEKEEYVAIFAEGKVHPLAIAKTLMSRDQMYPFESSCDPI